MEKELTRQERLAVQVINDILLKEKESIDTIVSLPLNISQVGNDDHIDAIYNILEDYEGCKDIYESDIDGGCKIDIKLYYPRDFREWFNNKFNK